MVDEHNWKTGCKIDFIAKGCCASCKKREDGEGQGGHNGCSNSNRNCNTMY